MCIRDRVEGDGGGGARTDGGVAGECVDGGVARGADGTVSDAVSDNGEDADSVMQRGYAVGALPAHQYVWVDRRYCAHPGTPAWLPAVWFGVVAYPGRAWGCTVLLESGAMYRNVPLQALATRPQPDEPWTCADAQQWNCYGYEFVAHAYPYLEGLCGQVRAGQAVYTGRYICSLAPVGDGFSAVPEQAKEFTVMALDNGRLTAQPTDRVLWADRSFTRNPEGVWPTDLRRQTERYSAE